MSVDDKQGAGGPAAEKIRCVVIDDDPQFLRAVARTLARAGCEVEAVGEPVEGLAAALEDGVDVVVSDIQMPHLSGVDLLREVKAKRPDLEVVLMTGAATVEAAVAAVKGGAYDYLTKPFEDEGRLPLTVQRAAERRRLKERAIALEANLEVKERFEDLVGQSGKMTEVFKLIDAVAPSSATVVLHGESGTGKELVARAIHRRSPRRDKKFVGVNCSALSETLLESELFGHVKGSFTGAIRDKAGLFEAADGGTLFLDEIGDTSPALQVRLLRVLQEGEIKRVGATGSVGVDVRVIAASNVDLAAAVSEGKFREDLFYRLNVIAIELPPLRDRPEDVPPLVQHFVGRFAAKMGKKVTSVAADAMSALTTHAWPGNVRELENAIERAVVLAQGDTIRLENLPPGLGEKGAGPDEVDRAVLAHLPMAEAKKLVVGAFERRYLTSLLRRTSGNISRAAQLAGIDRSNFRRFLKAYGIAGRSEPGDAEAEPGSTEKKEA